MFLFLVMDCYLAVSGRVLHSPLLAVNMYFPFLIVYSTGICKNYRGTIQKCVKAKAKQSVLIAMKMW